MHRVWRDGQKKNVFIYRFISTGTIEEKMLQRQIVKKGLSKTVVDEKNLKAAFSKEYLRQLFIYNDCKFLMFLIMFQLAFVKRTRKKLKMGITLMIL